MQGTSPLPLRSLVSQEQGDQLPSFGESIPCTPCLRPSPSSGEEPMGGDKGREVVAFPRAPTLHRSPSQNSVCGHPC